MRRQQGVRGRPDGLLTVQSRPQRVLAAQTPALLSQVLLEDDLLDRLDAHRTAHLARGVSPSPRKRRRHSGNSSDEDPTSQNRQQRDNQQDEDDKFRPASLDLLFLF